MSQTDQPMSGIFMEGADPVVILGKARETKYVDVKTSFELALRACELFEKADNIIGHIDALGMAGECCVFLSRYDEALALLNKGMTLIDNLDPNPVFANIYNQIGNVHYYTGSFPDSLTFHKKALSLREQFLDLKGQSASLNNIGMIHQRMGEYTTALEYHHKSLQIKEDNKITQSIWASLNNIGEIYQQLGEYTEALNFHFKSLEMIQDLNSTRAEWTVLTNVGLCYRALGDFENGLECLMKSLSLAERVEDQQGKLITMINLGDHFLAQNETEIASGYFRSSLSLSREVGNKTCEVIALHGKGIVNHRRGEQDIALTYLKDALDIAVKCHLKPEIFLIHKALSECYEKMNKISDAFFHHKLYHSIKEEVHNEDTGKKMKYLEYRQKLNQANKEVEIQRMKTTKLVVSMDRLKELMNVKNDFLGIVTHDLKNPLFGIQGLASVIISDYDNMSRDEVIETAQFIRSSSNQMFDLIRNLLEMNSLESGKIRLDNHKVSVQEVFLKTNSLFFHLAKEKEIILSIQQNDEELYAYADRNALSQVLDNIVSNAIKFSSRKSRVDVTAARLDNKILIQVQDEGPGMTKEDKKNLFKRFTPLSAKPTGGENSTGLGLNISKQLTELMNGRIWCESEKGKGCCFYVELPVE